jgi:hypothetical protein
VAEVWKGRTGVWKSRTKVWKGGADIWKVEARVLLVEARVGENVVKSKALANWFVVIRSFVAA